MRQLRDISTEGKMMIPRAQVIFLATLGAALVLTSCGGTGSSTQSRSVFNSTVCSQPPIASGLSTQVSHVFIVALENHSYSSVIGNTTDMPYLNDLANTYGYAEGYYANAHPSIPNYFMLTAGQTITTDDGF